MNQFLQLHLLTSYPPANLNRDDLGRPKTAIMGGVLRLRVSSQSLKRAWRMSEIFQTALAGHVGTRTKEMGKAIYQRLREKTSEANAREWAKQIAGQFGKLKATNANDPLQELEIEQLAHFSPEETKVIDSLILELTKPECKKPNEQDLKLLRAKNSAADIALFGRMLAASPAFNVEAAAQVAHALAVHRCQVEDDFFTAVDDLNPGIEDVGAGHMGEIEFGAALFYLYLCIDRMLLLENLNGDRDLYCKTLQALTECAATIAPTGKQNSFASRARASFVLAEKGDSQPRSLAVAFLKPISGTDLLNDSIAELTQCCGNMDRVYGPCAAERYSLNAITGEGTLAELLSFVSGD
ncbi:MAG: type I-E CRISPR-associated protein Cas7/Cse4/CasC [Candidatus Contendobacter sp.]|nr:type I-E CRISPR-associated protein Cas7/Cse4/CasC [Candidatus Contendobacter sp.]